MAWADDVAAMVVDNNAVFGVAVTLMHVTGRSYNQATLKNEPTGPSYSLTAVRGEDFRVANAPSGFDNVGRSYQFAFDPSTGHLPGLGFSIDKEDRITDGLETWALIGLPVRASTGTALIVTVARVSSTAT